VLCGALLAPVWAAETFYVNSENIPLNVRSGPGTEYAVLKRLPHGTQVAVLERWGLWARIALSEEQTEGWVLQRYLVPEPPAALAEAADMSPEQEQRRFARLQRKGIITVQLQRASGLLRLTINPLVWYRLTPHEQQNLLVRAKRLFGGTAVEMHDHGTDALLARLSATGAFEPVAVSPEQGILPDAGPADSVPPAPLGAGGPGQRR
jgi:hypothetical protein